MYVRNEHKWSRYAVFYICDLLCLWFSYKAAFLIRFGSFAFPAERMEYRGMFLASCFVLLLVNLLLDLTDHLTERGLYQELIVRTVLALCILSFTSLYLFALKESALISRLILFYTSVIFLCLDFLVSGLLVKKLYIRWERDSAKNSANTITAFLVTDQTHVDSILQELQDKPMMYRKITGLVLTDNPSPAETIYGIPTVNTADEAAKKICREWIDEVIIYLPDSKGDISVFLERCKEMGITVHTLLDSPKVNPEKQFVESIGPYTSLTTAFSYIAPRQAIAKRCMDILGGLVGSAMAIVIGIIIGPIIFICSPGPIIFRQKRIGRNGKPFYVLKFRSMVPNADDIKNKYMTENRVSDGMMFKLDFDPRVIGNKILPDGTKKTGIGQFIRSTSLDEFPQFFNVLVGEMSLVGTRPPTVDEWEKYEYHHRARLSIKPGITGLWQISGRSEITDFEEVVKLDTEYITHFRLLTDIKILLKTIVVLFKRKGAK